MKTKSRFTRFFNALFPIVLALYAISIVLPWCVHPSEAFYKFFTEGTFATIYHYKVVLLALYMVLVCVFNRKLPEWRHTIIFLMAGFYIVGLIFLAQRNMSIFYTDQSGTTTLVTMSVTLKQEFAYYEQYLLLVVFAYSCLFIAPIAGVQKKSLRLFLLWSLVAVAIISVLYSFYADEDVYKVMIQEGQLRKSIEGLNSFFGSKNQFGATLYAGFMSALVLLYEMPKWSKLFPAVISLFLTGMCVIIRCDGAAMSCAVSYFAWVVFAAILNRKKHYSLSLTVLLLAGLAFVGALVAVYIPAVYQKSTLLTWLNSVLTNFDFTGRTDIWSAFLNNLSVTHLFVGTGYIGQYFFYASFYGQIYEFSLHNAFVEVISAGGIPLVIFYLWLIVYGFVRIFRMKSNFTGLKAILIAVAVGFLAYSFIEVYIFYSARYVISAVATYLFACYPSFVDDGKKETRAEIVGI